MAYLSPVLWGGGHAPIRIQFKGCHFMNGMTVSGNVNKKPNKKGTRTSIQSMILLLSALSWISLSSCLLKSAELICLLFSDASASVNITFCTHKWYLVTTSESDLNYDFIAIDQSKRHNTVGRGGETEVSDHRPLPFRSQTCWHLHPQGGNLSIGVLPPATLCPPCYGSGWGIFTFTRIINKYITHSDDFFYAGSKHPLWFLCRRLI